MAETAQTDITLDEAVPLAHCLVDRVAADLGVRVLFIKGPLAAEQSLRPSRISLDVDVMVDPERRPELAAALIDLGWVDEHPYRSPTVLPQHSLTHRHPSWPCELDLHDRFPGLFADQQAVFERLWTRRTTGALAGHDLPCPDLLGHALILALHSLRDPHDPTRKAELADLVHRLEPMLAPAQLRELSQLTSDLGAADTAAPFLLLVGAPEIGVGTTSAADLHAWHLRTDPSDTTAVSWVYALRGMPLRRWPGFLWYAATLSDQELRLAEPGLTEGGGTLRRARVRRLRRGLRALPAAIWSIRNWSKS